MARDAEVVVVGAGITGAATARALALSGCDVLVLEQFEIGHDRGSSHGSSRLFRLSYPEVRWIRLAQASLDGWLEIEAERGEQLLRRAGSLDLGSFVPANARALAACGAALERLDAGEVEARFGIAAEPRVPALYQPDGGFLWSERALHALIDTARESGATVREQTVVRELRRERTAVHVVTDREEIRARAVVVAAGAWARYVLAPLEIDLPVIPTRETVVHVALRRADSLPVLIDETIPEAGSLALERGGQITYALPSPGLGLKIGLHHSGPVADPNDPGSPDEGVIRWASEWLARRFPGEQASPELVETCLYTNTADESFVLERHGRVVVASACSGHGFKFAPALGQTLAALAREASG
jgi:sarcosine oxidase